MSIDNPNKIVKPQHKNDNNLYIGAFIILAGILFLFKKLLPGILPSFIFSWQTILVIIGIILGLRNQFKGFTWLVLILIGSGSLLNSHVFSLRFLQPFLFPLMIIALGVSIIFKSRRNQDKSKDEKQYLPPQAKNNIDNNPAPHQSEKIEEVIPTINVNHVNLLPTIDELTHSGENTNQQPSSASYYSNPSNNMLEEFVNINSIFGSNEYVSHSKKLEGGKITNFCSSVKVDLHYSSFENILEIDVFCMMGAVELHIPSNWYIKNETTTLLAGYEDERRKHTHNHFDKTVIIRGTIIMGSMNIKN